MRRVFLIVAFAVGCAATLPPLQPNDVERAQMKWPDIKLADLERGRDLYQSRCTTCHSLYSPRTYSPERWPVLVQEMVKKARLDDNESADLIRYLTTASADTRGARR